MIVKKCGREGKGDGLGEKNESGRKGRVSGMW